MQAAVAREIWHRIETINAVAYFTTECRDAATALGLKGFWMGYFACRAAPLGPVPAGVVEATFYNFHPARVARAVPDAWAIARPTSVLDARLDGAAAALRRLLTDDEAERLSASVLPLLSASIDAADGAGRPLFCANRELTAAADPVAALWQATTTMREQRGDGHVAVLTAAGLDGCAALALFAAVEGLDPAMFQQSRGWSADDWSVAIERLSSRGLLDTDGAATVEGVELRAEIEQRTDELAIVPYVALGDAGVEDLLRLLYPAARRVAMSGEISFPNPMGLPGPTVS